MQHNQKSPESSDAAPPERHVRLADRQSPVILRATFWLLLGFTALALPFIVLLTGERAPAREATRNFAMGLGFAALSLAALQFALTGRIKALAHPFGADIVLVFHRYMAWGAVALMLGHFGILYVWYQNSLGVLNPFEAELHMTAARAALLCFVGLILSSELRKWLKLDYLLWRWLHIVLAVSGFALAVWHVLGVGYFTAEPRTLALWLGVTLGWALLLTWTRLLRPWYLMRNPWRVVDNRPERGGVHTLVLRPEGAPLKAWRPGQFAWLSVGRSPFSLNEHPFTISTPPDHGPDISFSIKPLGDDTKRLVKTKPGARAYVDGPYGLFSIDREATTEGFVMIAGGVGITPIIANLHALRARKDKRPVILIYANSTWDDVPFREELDQIVLEIDLTIVHVIEEPPDDWTEGETGRIDADLLARHLPEVSRDYAHLLCGPAPMTGAAIAALRDMGVATHHIDTEVFELA